MPKDVDSFFGKAYRLAWSKKAKELIDALWGIAERVEKGLLSEAAAMQKMRVLLPVYGFSPMDADMAYSQAHAIKMMYAPHSQKEVSAWDGVNKPFDFDKTLGLEGMQIYANARKPQKVSKVKPLHNMTGFGVFDFKVAESFPKFVASGSDNVGVVGFSLPQKKKAGAPKLNIDKILWGVNK